jgi:hypothetical protein
MSIGESVWITIGVVLNSSSVSAGPFEAGNLHPERSAVNATTITMTAASFLVTGDLLQLKNAFDKIIII